MSYSTLQSVYIGTIDITKVNPYCRFERIEMVENVTDVLPEGTLVVTELKDTVSSIERDDIRTININFTDGSSITGHITSVSYVNNASSDNDTPVVAINFTNDHYQYLSTTSLNSILGYNKPTVFKVSDFVSKIKSLAFGAFGGYLDSTSNYFLYRPFIPYNSGDEAVPDNAIEMMQYLTNGAVNNSGNPYFAFWTTLIGGVNFKFFYRNIEADPASNDPVRISVYDGDTPLRRIDGIDYRKAYFVGTNPAYQWISKNYYYIRKTPKYLDENVVGDTDSYLKKLTYHFQDDGEKYNVDVVTISGRGGNAPQGGDNIFTDNSWGYFDGQVPTNQKSITNLIGNQYGLDKNYSNLQLMGTSKNMPFLDTPDMWKNMFDLTPIHPNYPEGGGGDGEDTNLQKVMNIRYETFQENVAGGTGSRLEELRKIEAQNFVLHSLCCMGKEDCFFALLQKYELDELYSYDPGGIQESGSGGTDTLPNKAKFYRYKWNKINFGGSSGGTGGSSGGNSGPSDVTQFEGWSLDPVVKSSDEQDKTWAVNLNEKSLSETYLPPGWLINTSSLCKFRPIGTSKINFPESDEIKHIVRMCLYQADANKKVAYFNVENIVDCNC